MKTICIVCDGTIKNKKFHKEILLKAETVICADGGANHCESLNIVPNYVIGDMDSIDKNLLKKLQKNYATKVIIDKDQNKLDSELALRLAVTLKPESIIFLGAVGDRMDHTLANIYLLNSIPKKITATIIDNVQEISLAKGKTKLSGEKGDFLSVLSLTDIKKLNYDGLKWSIRDKNIRDPWTGISNEITKEKVTISMEKGSAIIIRKMHT